MKKNVKKLVLGALSFVFGLTVWTGVHTGAQTVNAEGETYTLKFVDTSYIETLTSVNVNGSGSGSLVEDEAISGKAVKVEASDTSAYPYFRVFDGNVVTAGDTYHIRLKVKGDGTKFHLWQNLAKYELIDDWVTTTSEWVEYSYDYTVVNTATENVMLFCQIVSVPEGGGCFYIEDISVEKTVSVTNGSAIGSLPMLEDGLAWTIDGEIITADTVWNYTADQTATTKSVETLAFTYPDIIESMETGAFGAVYNATAEITETGAYDGKVLKFTTGTVNTDASASPWICLSSSVVPAGEYVVNFKMLNTKYVNVHYQIGSYDYSSTTTLQANVSNKAVWTDYEYSINLTSDASSLYLLVNAHPGAGEVYVDELTFTLKEDISKYVFDGKPIGELPALGEDMYWAIDGEKITEDTVWTYEGSKTATIEYVKYLSFDPVCGDLIDDVFTETWVGTAVNGGVATVVGEEDKQVEVSLKANNDAGRIFLSQTILTPDDVYTLKFKMKGDGTKVHLYFMPGDTLLKDWAVTTSEWTEYTYIVTVKVADGAQLWVKAASVVSADSKVYIDDISFEKPIETMVVDKGEAIGNLPAVPEREHYVGAWTIDGEAINADTVWSYNESKTAKLLYKANTYTVTFKNGEEVVGTQTYTVENTAITAPVVPAKDYYTGVWENYTLDGGDKTVNAVYTANTYTVTFKNGEEVVGTQTYTVENTAITVPEVPAKNGYTGAWESYELNGGDKTVNAVYTANTYTVTFKNGEEVVETQTYTVENTEITVPEVPSKDYYTGAWESYELNGGDKTVNAVYTANTYTVTFKNGEEVVETQTYTVENTAITVPEVPAKNGYTGAWESYELNGGDKTVNAVYTINIYTVTFKNGEVVVGTQTYTVENTAITVPEVPAKDYYTGAWESYELNGGDKTVNAVYTANTYTVTFKNGEEVVGTQTYTVDNTEITVPEVPAKEGYTGAWESYELNGGDKTVNAVYTQKPAGEESSSESVNASEGESSDEGGCFGSVSGATFGCAMLGIAVATLFRKKKED